MITVALRQHRAQLLTAAALMLALSISLVWTGRSMTGYLHSTGLSTCLATHGECDTASRLFETRYGGLLRTVAYLNLLPMLAGLFWGAPLIAHELEAGTHRLAWTQSITRRRWLVTQLALLAAAAAALGAVISALFGWWLHPFGQLDFGGGYSRVALDAFDLQGIVPIAYSLYAFALGTAAGAVLRRTVPAMALTIAGYLPLRLVLQNLRGHFVAPLHVSYQALGTSPRTGLGDWVLSSNVVNAAGQHVADNTVIADCGIRPGSNATAITGCLSAHGFHQLDTYQPTSRFWTLQFIESGIYLGLAVLLTGVCLWWVTHRST